MKKQANLKKTVLDLKNNYGLSIIDLAKEIGISKQFFYKVCSGYYKMPVKKIVKFVNILKKKHDISEPEILNILELIFKNNGYIPLILVPDKKVDELVRISLIHSGIFDNIANPNNSDLNSLQDSEPPEADLA